MEYNMEIILICFGIISFVFADSGSTNKDASKYRTQAILDRDSMHVCPLFGTTKFEVETVQTTTPMYGCAYMYRLQAYAPLFHLLLERPEKISVHGDCNNTKNMDHFVFECLSKHDFPTNEGKFKMGWQYISLLDRAAVEPIGSPKETRSYRCALYVKNDHHIVRSIHMVISKPVIGKEFNISQCKGLSVLMARDLTRPKIPEGYRYWPDGSLYIYLIGRKPSIFINNQSTTTATRRPTITKTTTRRSRRPTTTKTTTRRSTTSKTTTRRPTTTTTITTTGKFSETDSFYRDYFLYINGRPW